MNRLLDTATELLREILARAIATPNDAVSLILTGEVLRRVAAHDGGPEGETAELLARYEEALRTHTALIPHELDEDLNNALDRMRQAAEDRSGDSEDVLRGVDDVLMVAAAAHRIGKLSVDALDAFAASALAASRAIAPDAHALWTAANDRAGRIGPDPSFPRLSEWLEPLASFSDARMAAELAVRRGPKAERRERTIAAVLARRRERLAAAPATKGAKVISLFTFRHSEPTEWRAAAAHAPPMWDDASGGLAYDEDGITVRVREHVVPSGSEVVIRIEASEDTSIDLAAPGTVVVEGEQLREVRTQPTRLLWIGAFIATGDAKVRIGSRSVSFTIQRGTT